jgi:SAM-dependent methyltransferase
VDWSSAGSQLLRFAQLLKFVEWDGAPALLDYGCGYGALAKQLCATDEAFSYTGFDLAGEMIVAAREQVADARCTFTSEESELGVADYTVASGIFNVKLDAGEDAWHDYVVATLDRIASLSGRGFAFNMLTRYADPPLMRGDLYYGDPGRYFHHCKERYSREVALLHDYELYEFTILVRLGSSPKPLAR